MSKYDDLIKRIEELERKIDRLAHTAEDADKYLETRITSGDTYANRRIDSLTRQVEGISKQANETEKKQKHYSGVLAQVDAACDMRREDIGVLREEQDGLRAEQRAQAHTQLDFGKRLAALEQVWWNAPIGDETHRRIEQLVESAALDNERRLREELRGALDKRIADLRADLQLFKDLAGNNAAFLKAVQVEHGNRLERLESSREEVTIRMPEFARKPKTPSWREVVDRQQDTPKAKDDDYLMSSLLYHLRRLYNEDESRINALARIISLLEKNKKVTAKPEFINWSPVQVKNLGRAILNESWGNAADYAAVLLAAELAK